MDWIPWYVLLTSQVPSLVTGQVKAWFSFLGSIQPCCSMAYWTDTLTIAFTALPVRSLLEVFTLWGVWLFNPQPFEYKTLKHLKQLLHMPLEYILDIFDKEWLYFDDFQMLQIIVKMFRAHSAEFTLLSQRAFCLL